MADTSGITIRITPQELQNKAEEATGAISTMETSYESMVKLITDTSDYWEGEAGDTFRTMFQDREEDVRAMIKRLKDHPANLLSIADVRVETEKKLVEESEMLPSSPLG